jgi:AcrR family transcriptional regulator
LSTDGQHLSTGGQQINWQAEKILVAAYMARQSERREAARNAILEAARDLFGRQGFADASVDEIAAKASVAKGAVYHYFSDKEAILEAVFEEACVALARLVAVAARSAPDALAAMSSGTRAYFKACAEGGTAQIVLRDAPAVLGWERWREIDERYFGHAIHQGIKNAIAQGLIESQPVEPLARLIIGAINEGAVACAASDNPATEGRRLSIALQSLLEGLRKR